MELIERKKFLNESKSVQKVFLDWWKPKYFDLLYCECGATFVGSCEKNSDDMTIYDFNTKQREWTNKYKVVPLFNQSQIIRFIEDNNYCIDIESYHGYQVTLKKRIKDGKQVIEKRVSSTWLLDLIWEMALYVALEIAKEQIK